MAPSLHIDVGAAFVEKEHAPVVVRGNDVVAVITAAEKVRRVRHQPRALEVNKGIFITFVV